MSIYNKLLNESKDTDKCVLDIDKMINDINNKYKFKDPYKIKKINSISKVKSTDKYTVYKVFHINFEKSIYENESEGNIENYIMDTFEKLCNKHNIEWEIFEKEFSLTGYIHIDK